MRDFQNRVSLVTGAASGIGRATALELARHGSHLILADINLDGLTQLAHEIRALGRRVLGVPVDLSKKDEVEQLARVAIREMKQVDLLFNNAGVLYMGEARQMDLETWEWIIGVNVWGPIRLTHALLPHMIERGSGHIVTTASIAGLVGTPGVAAYSLTKFAMVGVSEALRVELKPHGIDVSVVCPGPVKTSLSDTGRFGNEDAQKTSSEGILNQMAYSAERVAREIVRGVRKGKGQIVITPTAHAMWNLKRFSPELSFQINRLLWNIVGKNVGAKAGH